MLACLTTKPQFAAVLVLALGIWAIRQRRWGVVQGFAATLALLCLASTLVVPSWPMRDARADPADAASHGVFPLVG